MAFTNLGLSPALLKAISALKYTTPTAIQKEVIPLVLQEKDIMAQAQTGSGKSASFILPLLELLSQRRGEGKKAKIKALVLTPTRELTLQVAEMFERLGRHLEVRPTVVSIIGGAQIGEQLYKVQQGCDVLVATSGRFLDVLSKKQMNLSHIEFLVLDEADKMLNLGFAEELDAILEAIPSKRQNLMFSATYPQKIRDIAAKITQEAIEVKIEEEQTVQSIHQRVFEVDRDKRGPLLRQLLKQEKYGQTLVFMANKRATDNIAMKFKKYGILAQSFHGDLDQDERNETLRDFKSKKIHVLFATDIAARGLDIDDIDCVVNFDLPRSPADYIHRIGRTARAGKSGHAVSFIDYESMAHFNLIEKRSDIRLKREQVVGFELSGEEPKKVKGPAPTKGKGKSKKDRAREKAAQAAKQ